MPNILFAAHADSWAEYEHPLTTALDDLNLEYTLSTDLPPEQVDYIIYAPNSKVQNFRPYTRLKAVLNLWAGVEGVVGNETLTVPLARMVDEEGLTQGMVEWVTGHVLRHHLGMDAHIVNPAHEWRPEAPPLSRDRPVAILGLGTLGQACGKSLHDLGFPVRGWSRTPKDISYARCHHGEDGLYTALDGAQVVILLLPDTPATQTILNADTIDRLADGAVVLNPGRGALVDDDALLAALDSGKLTHATLDTFRVEPLPGDHPFWSHAKVTVTPHIASETRSDSAARVIAENVRRGEAGAPFLHLVDRDAGY